MYVFDAAEEVIGPLAKHIAVCSAGWHGCWRRGSVDKVKYLRGKFIFGGTSIPRTVMKAITVISNPLSAEVVLALFFFIFSAPTSEVLL
jgi:hypothetical protein